MTLKLVSNENDRRFYLIDEMGRLWASPCTVRSQEHHPGWSNKKTRPADLWAAIATDAEQARTKFMIAAVEACQGLTVEQLRQFAGGQLAEAMRNMQLGPAGKLEVAVVTTAGHADGLATSQ